MHKFAKHILSISAAVLMVLLAAGLTILAVPGSAKAQKATIEEIAVTNSDTHLLLYLTVRDCFTAEMESGIRNGIPATFTFYIELYKRRDKWPDRKIISKTINRSLTYDNLKEEFHINFSTKAERTVTASLAEAKTLMAEINGLKIIELAGLTPDTSYRIKVKAKLARKTLPLYFHYLVPFSSLWDFETEWHTQEFKY